MAELPKVFVSPMSNDIIQAVKSIGDIGFTATPHQVGIDGYVCSSMDLTQYGVICERDHGGNMLNDYVNDCYNSFKILHIDPWKYSGAFEVTCSIIETVTKTFGYVLFEVGTEEKVYPYTPAELDKMLGDLQGRLKPEVFERIVYVVVQGGAIVFNCDNVAFEEERFKSMISICRKYGKKSKEHNCDFLPKTSMARRFELGLDAYNIGPEIIYYQNMLIYDGLSSDAKQDVFKYCYDQNEWQRWTTKEELIVPTTLHYYYKHFNFEPVNMKDVINNILTI